MKPVNIKNFESKLRYRCESNIFILADVLEVNPLDLSLLLCEIYELGDKEWIFEISDRLNLKYEDTLDFMMKVWFETNDKVQSSPLISKDKLRF